MSKVLSGYQELIKTHLDRLGHPEIDPRHIEAFMRLQYGTLDHLSRQTFAAEAKLGVECIQEGGLEMAEQCAQSYGL
jgi:hypothetical protein